MDERRQASLMAMMVMFEQEGWAELMRELKDELENLGYASLRTKDTDQVVRMQGRAEQIEAMLYLQATVEALLTEAKDADV